jgi:hypothetical protein
MVQSIEYSGKSRPFIENKMKPLFELGQIVATPGALDALEKVGDTPFTFLHRHIQGDWGDLADEDKEANVFSITHGNRILSSYLLTDKSKLWIITEADRSSTTLLLPSEY